MGRDGEMHGMKMHDAKSTKNQYFFKKKDQVTYKGKPIRITFDFSMETLKARGVWTDVLQTLKGHRCQPTLLYQQTFQSQ